MTKTFKKMTAAILFFFVLGAATVTGMRTMEWLFPKPELRVLVCMAKDTLAIEACRLLTELQAKD